MATGLMPQSPVPLPACSPTDAAQAAPKPEVAVAGRLPVLDGLRGIAILLVMVFHFWSYGVVFGGTVWDGRGSICFLFFPDSSLLGYCTTRATMRITIGFSTGAERFVSSHFIMRFWRSSAGLSQWPWDFFIIRS